MNRHLDVTHSHFAKEVLAFSSVSPGKLINQVGKIVAGKREKLEIHAKNSEMI